LYLSRVVRLTLRKLLKARGMTPYQLAKVSGLSFGTIYRMTRKDGRFGRIEAETLDKLCSALDVEPGALFERTD
jgi:DNA-binding Xre family transcriptional regulator